MPPGQKTDLLAGDESSFWKVFGRALVTPSMLSLAVAGATILILFSIYLAVFGQWFTASPLYKLQMTEPLDTYTNVTHKVLSRQGSPRPAVVLLGTSVAVRCFESESYLAQQIGDLTGKVLPVHDLTTDQQAVWEMISLLEHLPPGQDGVVVIGITSGVLQLPVHGESSASLNSLIRNPRLGLTSTQLDEKAREAGIDVPVRTGIFAIDNAEFVLSRRTALVKNLIDGGTEYGEPLDAWWYSEVDKPEFWDEEILDATSAEVSYHANSQAHFATLAWLFDWLRDSGDVKIILAEMPINPRWWSTEEGSRFFNGYRRDLETFARKAEVDLVKLTDVLPLKPEDFVDMEGHIRTAETRRACSDAIAGAVANALRGDK